MKNDFKETYLIQKMNKWINFEEGILNRNHAFRINIDTFSPREKKRIDGEISEALKHDVSLTQKAGVYKVVESSNKSIGYVVFVGQGIGGNIFFFTQTLTLIDHCFIKESKLLVTSLVINPTDWLRGEKTVQDWSAMEQAWQDHLEFKNITIENFSRLERILKEKVDVLQERLGMIMIQNKPSVKRLEAAHARLESIENPHIKLNTESTKQTVKTILGSKSSLAPLVRVNWGLFNRCPLTCRGCYNIFNDATLSLEQCKRVVDKLVKANVQELILSGGDPLLWTHIVEFCEYAKNQGLLIGIDTVSYTFSREIAAKLKNTLAYIGIPLDGVDQRTIEKFRRGKEDLLDVLIQSLKNAEEFKIPVRLNTTVHKNNIMQLMDIAAMAQKHAIIKSWSLYQFWPLRSNNVLKDKMYISDGEFDFAIHRIKHGYPDLAIHPRKIERRERSTLFISSNGEVYVFSNDPNMPVMIVGNILRDSFKELASTPVLRNDSEKFAPAKRFYDEVRIENHTVQNAV